MQPDTDKLNALLDYAERLLSRLKTLLPPMPPEPDWDNCIAFSWRKLGRAGLSAAGAASSPPASTGSAMHRPAESGILAGRIWAIRRD